MRNTLMVFRYEISTLFMIHSYFYAGTLVKNEALLRLQNLLSTMEPSWDIFTQQIGVPNIVVTRIQTTHARTSPNWQSTCFTEALKWWVANHRNPTYEVIIAVLDPKEGEMNPIMNRALAKKVREFMAGEQGGLDTFYPLVVIDE